MYQQKQGIVNVKNGTSAEGYCGLYFIREFGGVTILQLQPNTKWVFCRSIAACLNKQRTQDGIDI